MLARQKGLVCLILSFAMAVMCACSVIDSSNPDEVDNADVPADSPSVTGSDETEDAVVSDWSYSFGSEFILENGIEYVWKNIDENTRINLGELMNAIRNVQVYCPLSIGFPKEESDSFFELVSNCTTYYSYVSNKYRMHIDENNIVKGITINYIVDYEYQAFEMNQLLETNIDRILERCPDDSDFEKIRYLHDELILRCEYGEDSLLSFTAYGALVQGKGTCQGYVDALQILLTRAGFETVSACGNGIYDPDVKHMWCYVKCDDQWYIIDPTWDDPQNQTDPMYIGYDYFLISSAVAGIDHTTSDSPYFKLPNADSMEKNFHRVCGYYADDTQSAYDVLLDQAVRAASEGKKYLYLRFDDGDALLEAYNDLSTGTDGENMIQDIISRANDEADTSINTHKWLQSTNKSLGTLTLTLIYE